MNPKTAAKDVVQVVYTKDLILTEHSPAAKELYDKSRYGDLKDEGRIQLSALELLYLEEKHRVVAFNGRNKPLTREHIWRRAKRYDLNLPVRYAVFRDLRDRGYIVKTALKFGADFRVYDRGIKPGEDHAKWVVFPIHETESLTWYEFSAKNRVAHSTRKKLLLGIVDDEGDVTYYECRWLKP